MRLNVEVPNELYEEFSKRASRAGRSMSDVVKQVVGEWIQADRRAEADLLFLDEKRKTLLERSGS